jgi:phosphatidylglycerophosphate synthase
MTSTWSWSGLRSWVVHGYTATGAVLALLIVLAAVEGDVARALWLGLAALVIDGTDGMLARRYGVKERLPWFDGALLDNIVDYLTYVFAPMVLLLQSGYLPDGNAGTVIAALPLVASSYQFCRVDAKTDDHFFLGFPSYWNVVAFYAIAMDLTPAVVDGRRGLRSAGARAGRLHLPVAHERAPHPDADLLRRLARALRRHRRAAALARPLLLAVLARLHRLLRRPEPGPRAQAAQRPPRRPGPRPGPRGRVTPPASR